MSCPGMRGLLSASQLAEFFNRKGWLLFSVAKPKLNHNGRCHQPQIAQTVLWANQRAKHLHAASARLGRKIIQVYKRLLLVLFLIEQVHLAFAKGGKWLKVGHHQFQSYACDKNSDHISGLPVLLRRHTLAPQIKIKISRLNKKYTYCWGKHIRICNSCCIPHDSNSRTSYRFPIRKSRYQGSLCAYGTLALNTPQPCRRFLPRTVVGESTFVPPSYRLAGRYRRIDL